MAGARARAFTAAERQKLSSLNTYIAGGKHVILAAVNGRYLLSSPTAAYTRADGIIIMLGNLSDKVQTQSREIVKCLHIYLGAVGQPDQV